MKYHPENLTIQLIVDIKGNTPRFTNNMKFAIIFIIKGDSILQVGLSSFITLPYFHFYFRKQKIVLFSDIS